MSKSFVENLAGNVNINLSGYEAACWGWKQLWKSDQNSFSRLNICDVIDISSTSGIKSWLFTSSDGLVKSKSSTRLNEYSLMERLTTSKLRVPIGGNKINAHIITKDRQSWHVVDQDTISLLLKEKISGSIVSFSHLTDSFSFCEQQYECPPGNSVSEQPRIKVFNLCGIKTSGKILSNFEDIESALPTERILSLNKSVNEVSKEFISCTVKLIESRLRLKITKLVVVAVIEDESLFQGKNKTVWLHHIREIIAISYTAAAAYTGSIPNSPRTERAYSTSDKKSTTTYSEISNMGSNFLRYGKCQGDFCSFIEEDEIPHMEIVGNEGDLRTEVKLAKRRHRRNDANGNIATLITTSENGSPSHSDRNKGSDHERRITAKVDGDDDDDDTIDDLPLLKCAAKKVPYKSIVLSRQEMHLIESFSSAPHSKASPWPELLHHWWWRIGRSLAFRRGSVNVPTTSGHQISVAVLTAANINTLNRVQLSLKPSDDGDFGKYDGSVSEKYRRDQAGEQMLQQEAPQDATWQVQDEQSGESRSQRRTSKKESMTDSNLNGQMSWYYSDARVCEHCYSVYRDLDRRRSGKQKVKFDALQRKKDEIYEKNSRIIEKKIFAQRKFVSRLAALPAKSSGINDKVKRSSKGVDAQESVEFNFNNSSMTGFGEALAVPAKFMQSFMSSISHLTENDNGTPAWNLPAYQDSFRQPNPQIVPKCAAPPLPWQLTNDEQRAKYEASGSAFIRNIRTKAQDIAASVQAQKLLMDAKYQSFILEINNGAKQTTRNNIAGTEEFHDINWKAATGQINPLLQNDVKIERIVGPKKHQKSFNPDRLLHPWQRDMEKLKRVHGLDSLILNTNSEKKHHHEITNDHEIIDEGTWVVNEAPPSPQKRFAKPLFGAEKVTRSHSLPSLSGDAPIIVMHKVGGGPKSLAALENGKFVGDNDIEISNSIDRHHLLKKYANLSIRNSIVPTVSDRHPNLLDAQSSIGSLASPSRLKRTATFVHNSNEDPLINLSLQAQNIDGEGNVTENATTAYDDDGDDDDDDAIGWSPFVIPS